MQFKKKKKKEKLNSSLNYVSGDLKFKFSTWMGTLACVNQAQVVRTYNVTSKTIKRHF